MDRLSSESEPCPTTVSSSCSQGSEEVDIFRRPKSFVFEAMRFSVDWGFDMDIVEDMDGARDGAGDTERVGGCARGLGSSSESDPMTIDVAEAVRVLFLPPGWNVNCFGGTGEAGVTEMWGLAKRSAMGATICFGGSGAEYERAGMVTARCLGFVTARGKPLPVLALSGNSEDAVV